MLRDILDELANAIRADIGSVLAADGIDATIEPRFVLSPSEGICIDVFPGAPPRDSGYAAFGDVSGAYVVTVRARVTVNDYVEMQDILADMIDDQHALSVAACVVADQSLDGWTTQVFVDPDGFSGLQDFSLPGVPLVGCTWRLLVAAALS